MTADLKLSPTSVEGGVRTTDVRKVVEETKKEIGNIVNLRAADLPGSAALLFLNPENTSFVFFLNQDHVPWTCMQPWHHWLTSRRLGLPGL